MRLICMIIITSMAAVSNQSRGPHHPRGEPIVKHHVHYRPTRGADHEYSLDQQLLHDREHIQEHMEQERIEPDLSNLTDEELEFYYFQVHDTDRNSKLDGLEILQAILHTGNHANGEESEDNRNDNDNVDFDYYVELIDKVLEEDDKNDDGYLSYVEYVEGRRRDRAENVQEPIVKMIT